MSPYEVIYMLRPIREVEPGWWKLKWRPIFKQTFSIYKRSYSPRGIGFLFWRDDARNGWGRSYKHLTIELLTPFGTIYFWFKWDFVVMAEGPQDIEPRRPLSLPLSEEKP